MMSENTTNRDRSRHVDVKAQYLRDLVRGGHVKLVKFAITQNFSDALTKILARTAFEEHREYMWGAFFSFYPTVETKIAPVMAHSIQFPCCQSSCALHMLISSH